MNEKTLISILNDTLVGKEIKVFKSFWKKN